MEGAFAAAAGNIDVNDFGGGGGETGRAPLSSLGTAGQEIASARTVQLDHHHVHQPMRIPLEKFERGTDDLLRDGMRFLPSIGSFFMTESETNLVGASARTATVVL